jgi:hypothetical protein
VNDNSPAFPVFFCSDVGGKIIEFLGYLITVYLSRDCSIGKQEFEPRDFARVSTVAREHEVSCVISTPRSKNGVGEFAQSAMPQIWQARDGFNRFAPKIAVKLTRPSTQCC